MRIIKVQGKGFVSVEPDMVKISFDVNATTPEYARTLEALNKSVEELRKSIAAAGIDKGNLKTHAFNIHADWDYVKRVRTFMGYKASHRLTIELPMEKELLNQVLDRVARGASEATFSLAFTVKDEEPLRRQVMAEAVRIARANAETIVAAAGVTLGELQQIEYGWSEIRIGHMDADLSDYSPACYYSESPVDIQPRDVTANDTVTLVYEVR